MEVAVVSICSHGLMLYLEHTRGKERLILYVLRNVKGHTEVIT